MADITLDTLRLFVNERLTAVAEDILSAFIRTIFQYQQEIDIQRKQLQDSLNLNPDEINASDFFTVCKMEGLEASPEQQDRSSSLALKEVKELKITEEVEELLQWPDQADRIMVTVPAVKTDGDYYGESEHTKPQADVEDGGAPQPSSHVQPLSSHCSDSDTEDSDEWEQTRDSLNTQKSPRTYIVETLPLNNLSQDRKPSPPSRSYKGKKRHGCTHCGRRFLRAATLKMHLITHSAEKPLSCTVCGKKYALKVHLIGHMRAHKAETAFNCTVCGKGFTQSGHLEAHLITHTVHLTRRIRAHEAEKAFNCTVCGKEFTQSGHLKEHMLTHTEVHLTRHTAHKAEKAFSCTVCGKEFTKSRHLEAHMITHTGHLTRRTRAHKAEKAFGCTDCGKRFTQSGHLKVHAHLTRHMRAEKAEKAFGCPVCGKEFKQSGHLKSHMITHTEDRPFKCTICGKGFNIKKNMTRHTWTHTREKPFHCKGCGRGFVEMADMRKHLRRTICGNSYDVHVYSTNT